MRDWPFKVQPAAGDGAVPGIDARSSQTLGSIVQAGRDLQPVTSKLPEPDVQSPEVTLQAEFKQASAWA